MKIVIAVTAAAILLCSFWSGCQSRVPLQDEESDLTNLQDSKMDEISEDTLNGADSYTDSEENDKEDVNDEYEEIDEDAVDDRGYINDPSPRRRPYRYCICKRRSSRRHRGSGWRRTPLPRPYK
ncbi:hypothetical protein OS493_010785 [Desmophyllum pertusum]|uniref:Secreted protein n=1 Tax=Desmophyllum pertusum TaxID=174260 RepID=A0A9W9ZEE8_9CNID|nr:hypothetical protein OS493_010785 [Desmophyllum pertusum]